MFREFAARCRNWQRDMPDQEAVAYQKRLYVELLLRAGIRDGNVIKAAAAKVCNEIRWYQLPDDFVALCREIAAHRAGLPDYREAYRQAVGASTKKHPAVIHALRLIGQFEFRRMTTAEASEAMRKAWSETVAHVLAGGELPEPAAEIEHKPIRAPRAVAEKSLGAMKAMLTG